MATKPFDQMTEAELVAFLDEAHEDPELWESLWDWKSAKVLPSGDKSPGTIYSLRIDPKDLEYLFRFAIGEGLSLDEFITTAALDAAKARSKRVKTAPPRKD